MNLEERLFLARQTDFACAVASMQHPLKSVWLHCHRETGHAFFVLCELCNYIEIAPNFACDYVQVIESPEGDDFEFVDAQNIRSFSFPQTCLDFYGGTRRARILCGKVTVITELENAASPDYIGEGEARLRNQLRGLIPSFPG